MWPLLALSFRPEVKYPSVQSSVHLWAASAVILLQMVTESAPTTPPPVAKVFMMVLVGFGGGWAAILRLPAIVGVVGVVVGWL